MRTLAVIYFDQSGSHIIEPETNETIKPNKSNIMKNLNIQTRIEAALLSVTGIAITVIYVLFSNF